MGNYALCPYYLNDSRNNVSCEDVCRHFDDKGRKWAWMSMYCDGDWEKCPYAADLTEAYYRHEKGDETALEDHEIKALRTENKSLAIKLGKAEKKITRMQKKIDELRAINQSFVNASDSLDKRMRNYYAQLREANEKLKKGDDNVLSELGKLGGIYEQRMCYLIDSFAPEGVLYEADVEEWAGNKAFALVADYSDGKLKWRVAYAEEKQEDEQNSVGGISGDDGQEA